MAQDDGNIIVGGEFSSFDGMQTNGIARLTIYGDFDFSFFPRAEFKRTYSIAVQNNNKIIVLGGYYGSGKLRIARLNFNGTIDPTFIDQTELNEWHEVVLQSDGKIIVVGNKSSTIDGSIIKEITRLNIDGNFDTYFNPGSGFDNSIVSVSIQNDDKI